MHTVSQRLAWYSWPLNRHPQLKESATWTTSAANFCGGSRVCVKSPSAFARLKEKLDGFFPSCFRCFARSLDPFAGVQPDGPWIAGCLTSFSTAPTLHSRSTGASRLTAAAWRNVGMCSGRHCSWAVIGNYCNLGGSGAVAVLANMSVSYCKGRRMFSLAIYGGLPMVRQ